MDPFFVRSKRRAEEVVSSSSSDDDDEDGGGGGVSSSSSVSETPNEKRVRLAKEMLSTLRTDVGDEEEEHEQEHENVARRLAARAAVGAASAWLRVAAALARAAQWPGLLPGAHRLAHPLQHVPSALALRTNPAAAATPFAAAASSSSSSLHALAVACAAKGGSMAVHLVAADGQPQPSCSWHKPGDGRSDVLSLCWTGAAVVSAATKQQAAVKLFAAQQTSSGGGVGGDGVAVGSGGGGGSVGGAVEKREIGGQSKATTAVCSDDAGTELYAGSVDGTLRVFDVATGVCLGTHFGHQEQIHQLIWLGKDRLLSCSLDKTIHLWKIDEEQQAVYRGPTSSIECVAVLQQRGNVLTSFVSGQQDGSLALWSAVRKRPVLTLPDAHGANRWIVSVASLRHCDLIASGSYDGSIRLWQYAADLSALSPVAAIAAPGFVNGLALATTSSLEGRLINAVLVAAIGTEHRLGRWWSTKKDVGELGKEVCDEAVNAVFSYPLVLTNGEIEDEREQDEYDDDDDDDDEDDEDGDDDEGEEDEQDED